MRVASPEWFVRTLLVACALVAVIVLTSCGEDPEDIEIIPAPGTATPVSPSTVVTEPTPEPTEFKVAYINLMSPRTLDETNTVPAETFARRLELVIAELKEMKPDIVAFSEATTTEEHGDVVAILARELKMEPLKVRTKPWLANLSKEQNEQLVKDGKFEEVELVLVKGNTFPSPDGDRIWLNPRTSEAEVPGALWVRLKGPDAVGDIDVFMSHLTGVDTRARTQQATDFANFITANRGTGPLIVLGDFGDEPGTPTVQALLDLGLVDVFAGVPETTCCRESVVGDQPQPPGRTDYLFVSGWTPTLVDVFLDEPGKTADGTPVYASDHNGVMATFSLTTFGP